MSSKKNFDRRGIDLIGNLQKYLQFVYRFGIIYMEVGI